MFVRCPFCHRWVLRWFYESHERKHTQRRSDGQMAEHVTRAPEQRFEGPLDGVPQAYQHGACGVATKMPEEIIRSYLVTPLMYNDQSFCCGDYVNSGELFWVETGESVMDYMGRLRADYLRRTYGWTLPDRPEGVFITPAAARALETIARSKGLTSFVFVLGLAGDGRKMNYTVDLAPDWDPKTETVVESSGIRVALPTDQRERLHGTVVDFREGARSGLSICRLYAPGRGR